MYVLNIEGSHMGGGGKGGKVERVIDVLTRFLRGGNDRKI